MAAAVLVAILVLASPAPAQTRTLEERAAAIDEAATQVDGTRVVLGHLSRRLSLPAEDLQQQRARTGVGWGDLLIANRLAVMTGIGVEQLVAERRTAGAWSDVAAQHGADVAALTTFVDQSEQAIARRSDDRAPAGAPSSPPSRGGGGAGTRRY